MVEVGDVPLGRECGCICPSCKCGLLARQGEKNEWHFAHDKDSSDRPVGDCEISFESACRLFAIDLLKRECNLKITTPERWVVLKGESVQVAEIKQIIVSGARDAKEYDDVEASMGEFTLVVHFDYSSRLEPLPPACPAKTAVLAFPVKEVQLRYQKIKGGSKALANIILSMFSDSNSGMRWLYHPRDAKAETLARQQPRKAMPSMTSREATDRLTRYIGGDSYTRHDAYFDDTREKQMPKPAPVSDNPMGTFTCRGCGETWQGRENTERRCPNCGGHLLSSFIGAEG